MDVKHLQLREIVTLCHYYTCMNLNSTHNILFTECITAAAGTIYIFKLHYYEFNLEKSNVNIKHMII